MLRLTTRSTGRQETVLEAHGSVAGEYVALLAGELESQRRDGLLVLDLTGARYIDQAGVDLLRRWASEGLEVRGGSIFIRTLLEQ